MAWRAARRAGNLDDVRRRPDEEQGVVRRVDDPLEPQDRLDRGDQEGDDALAHSVRTVVFGSVIMKKTKSWYIGPVIGATSASHGWPVSADRRTEKARNDAT